MEIKDRIRQARKKADMSQTALAEYTGVTRAAVGLWESGATVPRRDVMEKIASATGETVQWLEHGIDEASHPKFRGLYAVGEVAGGLWKEGSAEFKPIGVPVAPHPDYPPQWQRLYIVRGNSVNKVVSDGEYVHCVDVGYSGISPQHGDLVVVRRMEHSMAEYTAKRLLQQEGHWFLRPESTDPNWQDDIEFDGDDSTSIEITDVVIAKWSPISRRL